MNRRARTFLLIVFGVIIFCGIALVLAIGIFGFGCYCTDDADAILNRLREIDAAKMQGVIEHPGVEVREFSRQDLSPYVQTGTWKAVAGEIYLIHGPDEPTEALMTQKVIWIPKGAKVRFSPEGKVEVRTNTLLTIRASE